MDGGHQDLSNSILFFGGQQVLDESQTKTSQKNATTNVVLLKLDQLAKDHEVRTGDPTACKRCQAILNSHSKIVDKKGGQRWTCEFCGKKNKLELDEEEIPKKEVMDFVSGALPPPEETQTKNDVEDESSVIFCIDTSGSMSMTTVVKGGSRYKDLGNKSLFKAASNKNEEEVWVSRLEFVQSAVEAQLDVMKSETPKRKVPAKDNIILNRNFRLI